jgi:hypothetical protein
VWEQQDLVRGKFYLRSSITEVWYLKGPKGVSGQVLKENDEYYSYYNGPHYKTLEEAQQAEIERLRASLKNKIDDISKLLDCLP